MTWFYSVCAVVGGTIMFCQFVMTLIGVGGGDEMDVADIDNATDVLDHHDTTWLFKLVTFRSLVAAAALFGLTGLAADANGASSATALVLALVAGGAAMYGMYWLMELIHRLRDDGTVRVRHAVGKVGSVYLRIPARREGTGKVQLDVQGRLMEFDAMTDGDALPTGARIVVLEVIDGDTLRVSPVSESEAVGHV